jgi:hypothetical protein
MRKQGLSFRRASGWSRSDSHDFVGDPARFCASGAFGRWRGNRSHETHFHHRGTEVTEESRAFLSASIRLVAGLRPHQGCVAPTGLGRQSAAYPGLTPGAKLCRPSGTPARDSCIGCRSAAGWHDQRLGTAGESEPGDHHWPTMRNRGRCIPASRLPAAVGSRQVCRSAAGWHDQRLGTAGKSEPGDHHWPTMRNRGRCIPASRLPAAVGSRQVFGVVWPRLVAEKYSDAVRGWGSRQRTESWRKAEWRLVTLP